MNKIANAKSANAKAANVKSANAKYSAAQAAQAKARGAALRAVYEIDGEEAKAIALALREKRKAEAVAKAEATKADKAAKLAALKATLLGSTAENADIASFLRQQAMAANRGLAHRALAAVALAHYCGDKAPLVAVVGDEHANELMKATKARNRLAFSSALHASTGRSETCRIADTLMKEAVKAKVALTLDTYYFVSAEHRRSRKSV